MRLILTPGFPLARGRSSVSVFFMALSMSHMPKSRPSLSRTCSSISPHLVNKLLERYYNGDASKVPVVDHLAPAVVAPSHFVESAKEKSNIIFNFSENVPTPSVWLENLAGPYLRAILTSHTIVRGTSFADNPLKRLWGPSTWADSCRPRRRFVPYFYISQHK
jgi:fatty acid synthase subunit alpha